MSDQSIYTHQIRAEDGTIFGAVIYRFKLKSGQWEVSEAKVTNADGVIIGHDKQFARDYYANATFQGEKCPSWLVTPSAKGINAMAAAAKPEGFTQEAPPNEVALALSSGGFHQLSRLWLPVNVNGLLVLPRSRITAKDHAQAEVLAKLPDNQELDTYQLARSHAVQRTLEETLHMPNIAFGSQYKGRWYNPDAGNFVHVYDIGTTLESMYLRHAMSTFNKKSVSIFVLKDIENMVENIVASLLKTNTFSHDEVFALRRNHALEAETDEILKAVPAILPPPPGFTV